MPSGRSCGSAFRVGCSPVAIVSQLFSTDRPPDGRKLDPTSASLCDALSGAIIIGELVFQSIVLVWHHSHLDHSRATEAAQPGQYGHDIFVQSTPFGAFPLRRMWEVQPGQSA